MEDVLDLLLGRPVRQGSVEVHAALIGGVAHRHEASEYHEVPLAEPGGRAYHHLAEAALLDESAEGRGDLRQRVEVPLHVAARQGGRVVRSDVELCCIRQDGFSGGSMPVTCRAAG